MSADLLILDATNIACAAAADAKAHGADLPNCFANWLSFLQELVQPSVCLAVFDAAQVTSNEECMRKRHHGSESLLALMGGHVAKPISCICLQGTGQRRKKQSLPSYLQRRHRRRGAAVLPQSAKQLPQKRQPRLHGVAESAGCLVMASDGWEADDIVGALCTAATAGAFSTSEHLLDTLAKNTFCRTVLLAIQSILVCRRS